MPKANIEQIKIALNLTILANYGPLDQACIMKPDVLLLAKGVNQE